MVVVVVVDVDVDVDVVVVVLLWSCCCGRSWPTLAKTDFGQTEFDLCCVFLCVCAV